MTVFFKCKHKHKFSIFYFNSISFCTSTKHAGAVIEAMLRYSFISFLREQSGTGTRFTAMTKFIRPQKTRRPQKSLWIM